MKLEREHWCPLIGEECMKLKCEWFTQVRGKNPNTGEEVNAVRGCYSQTITLGPEHFAINDQQFIATNFPELGSSPFPLEVNTCNYNPEANSGNQYLYCDYPYKVIIKVREIVRYDVSECL